jgi:hypothetical protein
MQGRRNTEDTETTGIHMAGMLVTQPPGAVITHRPLSRILSAFFGVFGAFGVFGVPLFRPSSRIP